jgi:hypothetical protein
MSGSGIAALVGAAAPGMAQGVGNAVNSYQDYQADKKLDASVGAQTGTGPIGTADANHPVWGILNNLTGNPGNAPLPGGGAPVPTGTPGIPVNMPAAPDGSNLNIPTGKSFDQLLPPGQAPQGLAEGGIVTPNFGSKTMQPAFRGAIPTSGITPASTEGQMLMMDAGGVVPDGFHEQQGISGVPMSGRGAALIEGIQAGQNIGHNFQQAWHANRTREANAQYGGAVAGVDVNNPNSGNSPDDGQSLLGKAKDAVEGFFHHIHENTLDDNSQRNTPAPGSPNAPAIPAPDASAPQGPAGSPIPAGPGGAPAAPQGPGNPSPQGGVPAASGPGAAAGPAPGGAPAGGPTPGGPAPSGGPAPAGAPQQPVQPGQGQPQPVTPQQQATQGVTKQVAANDQVRQGIPDKSPEQSNLPHSMTPEQWQHLTMLKQKAVMAAARAGEDPAKVYESLTAMQNAHFQGQILKQLGTANVAFQNGDMDSVKKALKNVNYYLPNGQDIQFKDATAADAASDPTGQTKVGDPMYANPFYGLQGHEHEPQYTKIDAQHIQQLGVAALDPQNVQKSMLASYSAQNEAKEKMTTAQGAYMTGQGKRDAGAAAWLKADLLRQNSDVTRRLLIANGDRAEAEAGKFNREPVAKANSGAPKVSLSQLRGAQDDAIKYYNDVRQGQQNPVPSMIPDPKHPGQMMQNLDPHAGTSQHDTNAVPPIFQGMTPAQHEEGAKLAATFYGSNLGSPGMDKATAAELGARVVRQEAHPTTHLNPQTHQMEKDFVFDSKNGTAHIWVGNGYKNVYMAPNVIDDSPVPSGSQSSGGGGGGGGSSSSDEENNVLQD